MRRDVLTAQNLAERLRGVKNTFHGDVHNGERFSFPMNLASCCLDQKDVLKSIDVIMNVTSPIVF